MWVWKNLPETVALDRVTYDWHRSLVEGELNLSLRRGQLGRPILRENEEREAKSDFSYVSNTQSSYCR